MEACQGIHGNAFVEIQTHYVFLSYIKPEDCCKGETEVDTDTVMLNPFLKEGLNVKGDVRCSITTHMLHQRLQIPCNKFGAEQCRQQRRRDRIQTVCDDVIVINIFFHYHFLPLPLSYSV